MRFKACVMFMVAFSVSAAQLSAFDGLRKGFILGCGLGGSYFTYKEPWPVGDFRIRDKFCSAANFKIGYAPANSLEIYWFTNVSGTGYPYESSVISVNGVGLTKYLNKAGKGFFLFGGIGGSIHVAVSFLGESEFETGLGLIGGIGIDIAKHWSIQGDVAYATFSSGEKTSLAVRLTVNVLAF